MVLTTTTTDLALNRQIARLQARIDERDELTALLRDHLQALLLRAWLLRNPPATTDS